MATAKHFAVHGQPEGGTNTAPGNYSERDDPRELPGAVPGRRPGGARGQRHGLLQRDRRHPVARQPLAARQGAAPGVGLPRLCHLRRRRAADAGADPPRGGRHGRSRAPGAGGRRRLRPQRRLRLSHPAPSGQGWHRAGERSGPRGRPPAGRQVPPGPVRESLRRSRLRRKDHQQPRAPQAGREGRARRPSSC